MLFAVWLSEIQHKESPWVTQTLTHTYTAEFVRGPFTMFAGGLGFGLALAWAGLAWQPSSTDALRRKFLLGGILSAGITLSGIWMTHEPAFFVFFLASYAPTLGSKAWIDAIAKCRAEE
jgi:hypothetical protein